MARQGYDLQLTRYDECGWRATFYTTEMEHMQPLSALYRWMERHLKKVQRARRESQKGPRIVE